MLDLYLFQVALNPKTTNVCSLLLGGLFATCLLVVGAEEDGVYVVFLSGLFVKSVLIMILLLIACIVVLIPFQIYREIITMKLRTFVIHFSNTVFPVWCVLYAVNIWLSPEIQATFENNLAIRIMWVTVLTALPFGAFYQVLYVIGGLLRKLNGKTFWN